MQEKHSEYFQKYSEYSNNYFWEKSFQKLGKYSEYSIPNALFWILSISNFQCRAITKFT